MVLPETADQECGPTFALSPAAAARAVLDDSRPQLGSPSSRPIFFAPSGRRPGTYDIGGENKPCNLDPCELWTAFWDAYEETHGGFLYKMFPRGAKGSMDYEHWEWDVVVKDLEPLIGDTPPFEVIAPEKEDGSVVKRGQVLIDCHLPLHQAVQALATALFKAEPLRTSFVRWFNSAVGNPRLVEELWSEIEEAKAEIFKEAMAQAGEFAEFAISMVPGPGANIALLVDSLATAPPEGKAIAVVATVLGGLVGALSKKGVLKKAGDKLKDRIKRLKFVVKKGDEICEVVFDWEKFKGQIDEHHPIPKFLGGFSEQTTYSNLIKRDHDELHRMLRDALRNSGLPPGMPPFGGANSKAQIWGKYFADNLGQGAHEQALIALMDVCNAFDNLPENKGKHYHTLVDFASNFLKEECERFPSRCPIGK